MEELRILKQAYLREAILEAGYSPEKFIEYLESVKKDSVDIDRWTLEELKEEVASYKRHYSVEESSKNESDFAFDANSSEGTEGVARKNSSKLKEKSLAQFRIGPSRSKTSTSIMKEEEAKSEKVPSDTVRTKKPGAAKHEGLYATIKE